MFISRNIIRQTLAMTPVASVNFITGASFGWLSPTLQRYKNAVGDFSLTDDECSLTVAMQFLGAFAGCILFIVCVDRYGRNSMIYLTAILVLLSWTSVALTLKVVFHLLSRFFFGIAAGVAGALVPIYVAENCSPSLRGAFGSFCFLFYSFGILAGCILATYCSHDTVAYILAAISLLNLPTVALLREPAQHLLAQGRERLAESHFFWLRGKDEKAIKEFEDVKKKMAEEKSQFSLAFILDSRFLQTCIITSLAFLTGIPAMMSMVSIALVPTSLSANQLSILFYVVQAIAGLVSPLIIDQFRRRTLWISSTLLVVVAHCASVFLYFSQEKGLYIPNYEWWLFGSITAYGAISSALTYPLAMVARAELLPQRFRSAGASSTIIVNSLIGSLIGHSFLWIANTFGMKMNFMYFAISSVALLLYCYFCLPETRGLTLIEIEKMLES